MVGKVNIKEGDLLDPTPELPDDTPIDRVQLPTRIHKALMAGGLKTVGEIRETSNDMLLNLQALGPVRSLIFVKLLDCRLVMELGH